MNEWDDRQLKQIMFMLADIRPGCVCMNSTCPVGPVPHMATDSGNHPHPYGLIEDETHEWRRKRGPQGAPYERD